MKRWLAMFAALSLMFTFAGCDFSDDESDTYTDDGWVDNDWYENDTTENDTLVGECTAGQSAGYMYVKVEDSLSNPSLALDSGCNGNNPGADIDSVCIWRSPDDPMNEWIDGQNAAMYCASTVAYEPWADAVCGNDKDDSSEVLGTPDGVAADGVFQGYFSLNGGAIIVGFNFAAGDEILCGDMIHVVEMYNPDNPNKTIEDYKVSLGASQDGPWSIESDYATGEVIVDVAWMW